LIVAFRPSLLGAPRQLKKAKRTAEAISAYRQALARDDEHQGALFSLAVAYKEQGRFKESRLGLEPCERAGPEKWAAAAP